MGQPYVGEIRLMGCNFAPVGWMFCEGQLLPISENETLFNLIGTTYGGDGQSTFALPNLQSRVPVHQGSGFVLAQLAGEENVTLLAQQIPIHTHAAPCRAAGSESPNPANQFWGASSDDQYATTNTSVNMNAGVFGSTGGSQPHNNLMPYTVVNFIISLFGVYPSQT